MKTIPGKIVIGIDKKVYFEPEGLEKPKHDPVEYSDLGILTFKLRKAWEEYEASKQPIEVENVFWGELCECWFYDDEVGEQVIDNQSCKAEIIGKKATIIELIK